MVNSELLAKAKNYLDITWDDSDGDTKITGILERGMKHLDHIAGQELDYIVSDKPQELLFDYLRYVRADALDEFQKNYLHELISLQMWVGDEIDSEQTEIADV